MRPKVSIIMPAYNAERFIAQAIHSVIRQTYANWELIVVDDGSTDRTSDVIRSFAEKDGRIIHFSQPNSGQGKARNLAIGHARGDLLAFLDADDLWVENKLAIQITLMEETKSDLAYSSGYIFLDGASEDIEEFRILSGQIRGREAFNSLVEMNFIPMLSVVARRDLVKDVGGFAVEKEIQNCEDYDLWLTLAGKGVVFYGIDSKLVRYRRHPNSTTYEREKVVRPMITVLEKHYGKFPEADLIIKRRITSLYKELIWLSIRKDDLNRAKYFSKQLRNWDSGLVPIIQDCLLATNPKCYRLAASLKRSIKGKFLPR